MEEYDSSNYEITIDNLEDQDDKALSYCLPNEQENTTERITKMPEISEKPKRSPEKLAEQQEKPSSTAKRTCNCKKTQCLKLYCDCFRENLTCDGCNCVGCHNTTDY